MSTPKETNFFSEHPHDWQQNLGTYHDCFPKASVRGEASVTYTYFPEFPHVPANLHRYNPALKLVYVMRDPVQRFRSQYEFDRVRGRITVAPEQVFSSAAQVINRGRYGVQLRQFERFFPRDQIHLVLFEELVSDPATELERLYAFLGVDTAPAADPDFGHVNGTTRQKYLHPRFRRLEGATWTKQLRKAMPQSLRTTLRTAMSRGSQGKPTLDEDTEQAIRALVADDVAYVEDWLGRPLWDGAYTGAPRTDAPGQRV